MPMRPSPQDDVEQGERILRQGRETMRRLHEARTAIGAVTGVAQSPDGLVGASADGRGGITALRLDPRVMRLDHEALSKQVTVVLRAAQLDAESQAKEIVDCALADTEHTMPAPLDENFISERVEQIARNLL
ncbi:YbaB/EbfC family nucleoid-associated protein [Nonomuraea sp. CA-141351]|uniref:YbaB/EbfC family nucleoid-associated protein n=1 Tax=Nonomuraea sp. CA-141351 TaxID=3239996 RepID=UPI003D90CE78